jgi:hypothetical protein
MRPDSPQKPAKKSPIKEQRLSPQKLTTLSARQAQEGRSEKPRPVPAISSKSLQTQPIKPIQANKFQAGPTTAAPKISRDVVRNTLPPLPKPVRVDAQKTLRSSSKPTQTNIQAIQQSANTFPRLKPGQKTQPQLSSSQGPSLKGKISSSPTDVKKPQPTITQKSSLKVGAQKISQPNNIARPIASQPTGNRKNHPRPFDPTNFTPKRAYSTFRQLVSARKVPTFYNRRRKTPFFYPSLLRVPGRRTR